MHKQDAAVVGGSFALLLAHHLDVCEEMEPPAFCCFNPPNLSVTGWVQFWIW